MYEPAFMLAKIKRRLDYFCQITEDNYGATEVLELIPNGENVNVNKSNR